MTYLTVEDVVRELGPGILSGHVTEEDIAAIIEQVEAELDGLVAAQGYAIPVTAPRAKAMLAQAATFGACARILGAYAGTTADASPRENAYWQRYREFCDRLMAQPGLLEGADRASGTGVHGQGAEPIFRMGDAF